MLYRINICQYIQASTVDAVDTLETSIKIGFAFLFHVLVRIDSPFLQPLNLRYPYSPGNGTLYYIYFHRLIRWGLSYSHKKGSSPAARQREDLGFRASHASLGSARYLQGARAPSAHPMYLWAVLTQNFDNSLPASFV